MFKKLISNLPFNPSLLGQVSFYAKRLKAEESIRRMGFGFMALAMFIQIFAVVAPPQKSLAYSADYIAPNGFSSKEQILADWDNPGKDIQAIYSRFGVTRDMIAAMTNVRIRSTQADLWTTGRTSLSAVSKAGQIKQQYKDSEFSVQAGASTIYVRNLKAWDIQNPYNDYDAFMGINSEGNQFYILMDCGNYTQPGIPLQPTPVPPPPTTPTPEGWLDVQNCDGIAGWAWNGPHERYVHIYVDQPAFAGATKDVNYFEVLANQTRADVHTSRPDIATEVGYSWNGGPLKNDGKTHHIWVYVTDRGDNYALLSGGENVTVNFTCQTTPVPPTIPPLGTPVIVLNKTIDGGPRTLKPGDEFTFRFEYRNSAANSVNAENVVIRDTLDLDHFDIVAVNGTRMDNDAVMKLGILNGKEITIGIGSVAYSADYKLAATFTVKLKANLVNGSSVCNAATMTATNAATVTSGGTSLCVTIINPCPLDSSIPSQTDPRCVAPAVVCTLTQSNVNRTTKESTLVTTVTSSNPALTHIVSYNYAFGDTKNAIQNSTALTDTVKHVYKDGNYAATATVIYTIGTDRNSSHSAGCGASVETVPDQPLTPGKAAQNITQKLNNADTLKTKANAGDVIEYSLNIYNSHDYDRENYTITDSIGDLLDYTDLDTTFLASQGGKYDLSAKTVTWEKQTVKANSTMTKKFRVTVKNPVPSTNQPSNLSGSFNCVISNKYGDEVAIPINCPPPKTAEYIATTLPNTGPGTSVMIGSALMIIVAYFFYRSRLLGKEVELVRAEYATGGGF
jgi:hypothetical protein